jgi:hypothetical protein
MKIEISLLCCYGGREGVRQHKMEAKEAKKLAGNPAKGFILQRREKKVLNCG